MKTSCDKVFHYKYEPKCNLCREQFCKNCKNFRINFEMFLKNTNEIVKDYLRNFISDFLNIISTTLESFFPEIHNKKIISVEKRLVIKSYNKSEKNRPQVVNQELTDVQKIFSHLMAKKEIFIENFKF